MSRNKYLKFGLRADKNLADLDNPKEALDNILNNISSATDADGNPLLFTSDDILPLVGIADTGIAERLDEQGNATVLVDLAGNTVEITDDQSNTLINVEPKITIQDYIDNFKVVLGDPPWINGGDGPNAFFIPSERLNQNTTDTINSIIACDPGNTQGGGAQDLTVGNRYRIENLGTINNGHWNDIAGTTGLSYTVGTLFVCVANVEDAVGTGNHNAASCRNCTIVRPVGSTVNETQLLTNKLFTTRDHDPFNDIIGPTNFWIDGKFRLNGQLNPVFKDMFGGLKWEGYLSSRFTQRWETSGYFVIEEDVVEAPGVDNYTVVKAVTSSEIICFDYATYSTVDELTKIELNSEEDYKRICQGMTIELGGQESKVISVYKFWQPGSIFDPSDDDRYRYYVALEDDLGVEDLTATQILTFKYDPTSDLITTELLQITPVRVGERRKVRYSVWWPRPAEVNTAMPTKVFADIESGSTLLSFNLFYKTNGSTDDFGKFTFPFFRDNRAHVLKQDSNAKLLSKDTLSLEYIPKQTTAEVIPTYNLNNNFADHVRLQEIVIKDNVGKLESSEPEGSATGLGTVTSKVFSFVDAGDWLVVVPDFVTDWDNASSSAYCFQLLEVSEDKNTAYVSPNYSTAVGLAIDVPHKVMLIKNQGLVGVFKKEQFSLDNIPMLRKLDTIAGSMNVSCKNINNNDLIYSVETDEDDAVWPDLFKSHDYPLRITLATSVTDTTFEGITEGHPTNSSAGLTSTKFNDSTGHNGLSLVYASKGLNDLSALNECGLTFGLEVAQNAAAGDTKIYVTSSSSTLINQAVVYYNGGIPEATNTTTGAGATTITSATGASDATGDYVDLSQAITAPIPAGTTLVGVGTSYTGIGGKYLNREYCIIPLNTAPPFGSTAFGLETPTAFPSLFTRSIGFRQLSLRYGSGATTDNNILALTDPDVGNTTGNADAYATIEYNGVEYKMLVKNNITYSP